MDALVLTTEPTYPGVRVRARVVGLFWIATSHGREAKLVCVLDGDPTYRGITELAPLPEHHLLEIAHFFDIYRDLDPGKDVWCEGQEDAAAAIAILQLSR